LLRHLVEGGRQFIEFIAQLRRRHPNVVAALGNSGCGRGDFGDRALHAPAEIGGHHECGQSCRDDRDRDGDRGGVRIGLFGVELLVGVMWDACLMEVLTEQRRPDHRCHHQGREAAREQHQCLRDQQHASHPETRQRLHCPIPIR
jgi:hypothetical protein